MEGECPLLGLPRHAQRVLGGIPRAASGANRCAMALVSDMAERQGTGRTRCAGYGVRKENLLWLPINLYRQKMSINLFELEREKPTCA
jgi:hypothetical protein